MWAAFYRYNLAVFVHWNLNFYKKSFTMILGYKTITITDSITFQLYLSPNLKMKILFTDFHTFLLILDVRIWLFSKE